MKLGYRFNSKPFMRKVVHDRITPSTHCLFLPSPPLYPRQILHQDAVKKQERVLAQRAKAEEEEHRVSSGRAKLVGAVKKVTRRASCNAVVIAGRKCDDFMLSLPNLFLIVILSLVRLHVTVT